MNGQSTNCWRELCIAAAFEDDPLRLPEIVAEINRGLTERQKQLADNIFQGLAGAEDSQTRKHWVH
jgi:hypothetical protein